MIGSPGEQNFQLLTVDGSQNIGVAHGPIFTATAGATFVGWAADEYSDLRSAIQGAGASYSVNGTVDTSSLPATTDPRFSGMPVYGPEDVTSAVAFDLDPDATTATITVFLGGSPDGNPVAPPDNEPLRTPVHTKFNTYLGQSNFLELSNAGTSALDVGIIMYSLDGIQLNTQSVTLQPQQQFDVDINTMLVLGCSALPVVCNATPDLDGNGVADTYGLIRLDFVDNDPTKKLIGRMSHYRTNPDGSGYSFAFARELRNPSQGTSYAMGNTYDPQGLGYLVPNWVEVINLDPDHSHSFTYTLYNQAGAAVYQNQFRVNSRGEFDIHGGHEILNADGKVAEGVYLIEVVPDDGSTEYLMYTTRYSSNAVGTDSSTYNYAFSLDGRTGNTGSTFVPITNEDASSSCATPINWVEVVNSSDQSVVVTATFRDSTGSTVGTDSHEFGPRSQYHYNASALLPTGSVGVAEVSADLPEALVVQSLVYYHDCERNQVQTAFSTQGRSIPTSLVNGSVNSFLNLENVLRVFSVTSQPATSSVSITPLGGATTSTNIAVPARGANEALIGPGQTLDFPANSYGVISATADVTGGVSGQVLRVKKVFDGSRIRFDFVMPTLMR